MFNRDTVVGIAGASILLAAMVGIFYVQAAQAPAETVYRVAWDTRAGTLDQITGTSVNGQEVVQNVTLDVANLTEVAFTLTWTDNDPSVADSFTVTVTTPSGRVLPTASGGSGSIIVIANGTDLNEPPTTEQVAAGDEAAARAKLQETGTKRNGMGSWLVTITVNARGQVPDNLPTLPAGPSPDRGNAWALDVAYKAYEPALERVT